MTHSPPKQWQGGKRPPKQVYLLLPATKPAEMPAQHDINKYSIVPYHFIPNPVYLGPYPVLSGPVYRERVIGTYAHHTGLNIRGWTNMPSSKCPPTVFVMVQIVGRGRPVHHRPSVCSMYCNMYCSTAITEYHAWYLLS